MLSAIKTLSPVNKVAFPGTGHPPTYNSQGEPFAGGFKEGTTTYDTSLLWIPSLLQEPDKLYPILLVRRSDDVKPSQFVVVHFHGNACDLGEVAEEAQSQAKEWAAHVLMPEYPGYGVMAGASSEEAIDIIAQNVEALVLSVLKVPSERVIIFGRSVGTGPAAKLAARMSKESRPPAALLLQSPFTSMRDLAVHHAGFFGSLTMQRWSTRDNLCEVCAPILLLHGSIDDVIPFEHSAQLFSARSNYQRHCSLHVQEGRNHNDYDIIEDVLRPGSTFLGTHVNVSSDMPCRFDELCSMARRPPGPLQTTEPQSRIARVCSNLVSSSRAASAGVVQASVGQTVKRIAPAAEKVRQQILPLSGKMGTRTECESPEQRQHLESSLSGTTLKLQTYDGVDLDSMWCEPDAQVCEPNGNAAILFHGNGMALDDMAPWAQFYFLRGFHVLLITMRGYPGSDGDCVKDGEAGMYRDAAAAVGYAVMRGFAPNRLLAHGFSLGGSLAAAAAVHHGLFALTLDHTFTTAKDVALHVTRSTWLPGWAVGGAFDGAFPLGTKVDLGHGVVAITDGLNTLAKVSQFKGTLFVMFGTQDPLMSTSFATSFLQARYPPTRDIENPPKYAKLEGGHNDMMFFEDGEATQRYEAHLLARGLMQNAPKQS